jgi:hypothetical protein
MGFTALRTTLSVALTLTAVLGPWGQASAQAASTPTLVQTLTTSTNQLNTGNGFIINLPNAALANNCLILTVTYNYAAGRTVAITDNIGTNSWLAGPSTNDGTETTTLYYVLGVRAGTQSITVTFDRPLNSFQAVASEFYNVATSGAIDGSIANSTAAGPTVQAGSLTPTTDGDLIYQYVIDLAGDPGGYIGAGPQSTGISAGTGFTLLSACQILSDAAQYQVQGAHAPINPTMSVAGSNDRFNTVVIALKSAAAGTPPPPGIRIVHKYDVFPPLPNTVQFPSSGNLMVVTLTVSPNQERVTSVTDSNGNNYTNIPLGGDNPQLFYAAAASTSSTLRVTIVTGGGGQGVTMYDVAGAATSPFDKSASAFGAISASADITHAPDITPSTPNGLVFAVLNMGEGPPSGSIRTNYVFDSVYYTGEIDGSLMNSGDGRGHIYNSNTSTLAFGYHVRNIASSAWSGSAVAFKAGSTPTPAAPTNLRVVP